jgi:hypothetical protein
MLRDTLVGLIEPMLRRAGVCCSRAGSSPCCSRHRTIDPQCLENPRPAGAESTLTENARSPFHAEPRHRRPRFVMKTGPFLAARFALLVSWLNSRLDNLVTPISLTPPNVATWLHFSRLMVESQDGCRPRGGMGPRHCGKVRFIANDKRERAIAQLRAGTAEQQSDHAAWSLRYGCASSGGAVPGPDTGALICPDRCYDLIT